VTHSHLTTHASHPPTQIRTYREQRTNAAERTEDTGEAARRPHELIYHNKKIEPEVTVDFGTNRPSRHFRSICLQDYKMRVVVDGDVKQDDDDDDEESRDDDDGGGGDDDANAVDESLRWLIRSVNCFLDRGTSFWIHSNEKSVV
jgi:hypothetical protein